MTFLQQKRERVTGFGFLIRNLEFTLGTRPPPHGMFKQAQKVKQDEGVQPD